MPRQPFQDATDFPDVDSHWYGHDEPSAGFQHLISENQAVCLALADLGSGAATDAVQRYLRDVGLEVPGEVIDQVRTELARKPDTCANG